MTIPFSLPFARRRLVMSFHLVPAAPIIPPVPARPRRVPDVPVAYAATDAELARLGRQSAAEEERRRWETQAVLIGLRPR